MMLVFSGLVEEGMGYLYEALAALCAGDVEELPVVEGCLCGLFNACERTHDVHRAEQWLRAAGEVISRHKLVAVAGYCALITRAFLSPPVGGPRPRPSWPAPSARCPMA